MILRGLLVAAAGFLFIFSPGLPLGLLARRGPPTDRGLLYWGLGLWPLAVLPALFLQSLLRQAVQGSGVGPELAGRPVDYVITLAGALITALIVQAAMLLLLRLKRLTPGARLAAGLSLGFGIGLISQVFNGLALVSAGFRLVFGETADPMVNAFAQAPAWGLALSLLPLLLFRPALLVVCAARGVLVAQAPELGARLWWGAVAVDTLFAWLAIAIQFALGANNPGMITAGSAPPFQALAASLYYLAALGLAYWWLLARLGARPTPGGARMEQQTSALVR